MKNHHHNHPIHPTAADAPTHDAIAVGAYLRWIDLGQPENTHEAIWLETEKELSAKKI